MRTFLSVAATLLLLAAPLATGEAQLAPAPANGIVPDSPGALVLESVGGSAGSFAGIGAVMLLSRCDVEDIGCDILTVGAAGLAGVVGATVGTMLTARYTGSRRSAGGAALGAAVGTGVGLGVHYLLNNDSDRNLDDAVVIPIFAISQGTLAAIGSRLVGAARGMR
jgi:hypothetical protein